MKTSPSLSCRFWRFALSILSLNGEDWACLGMMAFVLLIFIAIISVIQESVPSHSWWITTGWFLGAALVLACYTLFNRIPAGWRVLRRVASKKVGECESINPPTSSL